MNLQLKLLFCLPITVNNNLPLKICYEKNCEHSISLKLKCDAKIGSNYVTLVGKTGFASHTKPTMEVIKGFNSFMWDNMEYLEF